MDQLGLQLDVGDSQATPCTREPCRVLSHQVRESELGQIEVTHYAPEPENLLPWELKPYDLSACLDALQTVLLAMKRGEISFSYEDCSCVHMPTFVTFRPLEKRSEGDLDG
jgi:hypothetical protein